jgi:hypothetical protein
LYIILLHNWDLDPPVHNIQELKRKVMLWNHSCTKRRGAHTTGNPLIYDEIHMTFLNFVINHTASMTNSQISSQIGSAEYEARYEVQTLWRCANFVIDFVTDHNASMTIDKFRHRLAMWDMKPDMKNKHYDVAPISS